MKIILPLTKQIALVKNGANLLNMESKQWSITKLHNPYFHEPASQLY
ncbi:MAG: hypothetical protein WCO45_16110 [Pseudanabaena sp. ELA607]